MAKRKRKEQVPVRKDGQPDKRYGPKVRPPDKPKERAAFAAWLATPPSLRSPISQAGFAAEYKVNTSTLSDWKRAPDVRAMVREHADAIQERALPEVWDALLALCRTPDVVGLEACRLALSSLGKLSPQVAPANVGAGGTLADAQSALLRAMNLHPVDPGYRPTGTGVPLREPTGTA